MDQKTAEFIIYMINEVANLKGKSTSQVYRVLSETGCIQEFLVPFYDVEHTLSSQNVVEDILKFVHRKGREI